MNRWMLPYLSDSTRSEQKELWSLVSHVHRKPSFFHEALGLEGEFSASVGWLTTFKNRFKQ
jgi:hypothetical protein